MPENDLPDHERPRLPLTTADDWDDETAALVAGAGGMNIFAALANHPKLLKRWLVFGGHVLVKSTLPARERELAILRTGWRCGSAYEFGQHRVIGQAVGLTPEEIDRVVGDVDDPAWSNDDRWLLRAVDELVDDKVIGDATWAALGERWTTQQLMDLVFAVGQYTLVSMALRTFGVPLDDGIDGFPS